MKLNKIKLLTGEIKSVDKVFNLDGFKENLVFDGDVFSFEDCKSHIDIFFRGDNYVERISRFKLVDGKLDFLKDHLIDGSFFREKCEEDSVDGSSERVTDVTSYFKNLLYLGNIHFDKFEGIEKKLVEINKDEDEVK